MKILAFSDVHCDLDACQQLVKKSENIDIVIGAGDFATARRGLQNVMDVLKDITKPFIIVPGNSESYEELQSQCLGSDNIHTLHGSGMIINDISFYGIGGGIPVTPFGSWSYDFSEEEASQLLEGCNNIDILVSHSPPYGAVDTTSSGKSIGSTTIRKTLLETSARLCICGHVHACAGQRDNIEEALVVNAGPKGIILEYE